MKFEAVKFWNLRLFERKISTITMQRNYSCHMAFDFFCISIFINNFNKMLINWQVKRRIIRFQLYFLDNLEFIRILGFGQYLPLKIGLKIPTFLIFPKIQN